MTIYRLCLFILICGGTLFTNDGDASAVKPGVDCLFTSEKAGLLQGKKVGLITNHTAINSRRQSTLHLFKKNAKHYQYTLVALFAPEHGLKGENYNGESIKNEIDPEGIPIYSLHGTTRRPTPNMLKDLNLLIYDIQDIGSRSYTYISTLFYAMEEAAKHNIPMIVLDRPNPINGLVVDGPMLEQNWRSFVGYVNTSYCHGMTIGELALFFNADQRVGCKLTVIPMEGWRRNMTFAETGLSWVPTSPHIPEADTAYYYPTTGLLGELKMVSIGVGYTLPFKLIGAPWIDADKFALQLNEQHFPGVYFLPFHFRPFSGAFSGENCHGVLIRVTDHKVYRPVTTQYLIMGALKNLYPKEFKKGLDNSPDRQKMFNQVNGTAEVWRIMREEKYITWKLKELHRVERESFITKRQRFLIPNYGYFDKN